MLMSTSILLILGIVAGKTFVTDGAEYWGATGLNIWPITIYTIDTKDYFSQMICSVAAGLF